MRYEAFIGLRHLQSTRGTFLSTLTTLAILGVAVGVAVFTTVVSVTGGFIDAFRDRVLGVDAHIIITRHGMYISDYAAVEEVVREVDGVVDTSPFLLYEMLITSPGSRSRPGALVRGIDVRSLVEQTTLGDLVVEGDLGDLAYHGELADPSESLVGVALGNVLAERLAVEVGDTVTLISPLRGLEDVGWRGENIPTYSRFRVAAIANTGFFDYDSRLVVADYRALQDLFDRGDVVTGIEVRVVDPFDTATVLDAIDRALSPGRYRMLDWSEIHRNLFASLKLQKLAFTIVMGVFLIISSFVILCVLLILVLEKRREIAILRSMGASAGGIMRVFLFEGVAIGGLGTAIGLGMGLGVCWIIAHIDVHLALEVYRIGALPVSVSAWEFAATGAGALLLSLVVTLPASWSASRISPVEALRYD